VIVYLSLASLPA